MTLTTDLRTVTDRITAARANMDERDLQQVADAFDKLLAYVAYRCDKHANWAIAAAREDILSILSGEWDADNQHPRPAAKPATRTAMEVH